MLCVAADRQSIPAPDCSCVNFVICAVVHGRTKVLMGACKTKAKSGIAET